MHGTTLVFVVVQAVKFTYTRVQKIKRKIGQQPDECDQILGGRERTEEAITGVVQIKKSSALAVPVSVEISAPPSLLC